MIGHSMLRAAAKKRAVGDPYWSNVSTLCNFTSNFNDVKGKTATTFGGIAISAGAATFDGVDDYFSFADSSDFALGSGDFTIEFFTTIGAGVKAADNYYSMVMQFSGVADNASLYCYFESRASGSNRAWTCRWFDNSAATLVNLEEAANAVNDYVEGQEYHIAIVRSGSTFTLYRDGVQKATATYSGSLPDAGGAVWIGRAAAGTPYYKGSMGALRITKGVARYTGPFTPPPNVFPEG